MQWADYFKLRAPYAHAFVPYFVYLVSAVAFGTCSAILVQSYAPQAFHTGIPGEMIKVEQRPILTSACVA